MLSAKTFNLYQPFINDESIARVESRTYLPFIRSFHHNDSIEIAINRTDLWCFMHDAALIVKGKCVKKSGNGSVSLINNAGAFLFDSLTYELNGTVVDQAKDPGILSTVRGFLCYEKFSGNEMGIAGWNFPAGATVNDDGSFNLWIPLNHLLNFFNEYPMAICGKQILRLVRSRNDDNAMIITPGENETEGITKGEITISSLELKVKHLYPNDIIKLDLLQSIRSDSPILMPFRRWELHELPTITPNAMKEVWNVKTGSAIDCPRFVICCFHENKKNNAFKDPNLFDNLNISNIRVLLNGEFYPQENQQLDFMKNDYAEAHYNYSEFTESYMNQKKIALLDYSEFKNRALFVIDCSRREESLKSSTVDIKIEIESRSGFPANTRAYCIIVYDYVIEHHPLSETVRKLA